MLSAADVIPAFVLENTKQFHLAKLAAYCKIKFACRKFSHSPFYRNKSHTVNCVSALWTRCHLLGEVLSAIKLKGHKETIFYIHDIKKNGKVCFQTHRCRSWHVIKTKSTVRLSMIETNLNSKFWAPLNKL